MALDAVPDSAHVRRAFAGTQAIGTLTYRVRAESDVLS